MNRTEKGLCRLGCGTGPNNRGEERCGVRRKARMRRYLHSCKRRSRAGAGKGAGAVQEQTRRTCRQTLRYLWRANGWRAVFDGIRALSTETGPAYGGVCSLAYGGVCCCTKKLRTRCLGPGVFRSAGASCAPVALSLFLLGGCRAHDDLHQVAVIEHLAGHGLYVGVG